MKTGSAPMSVKSELSMEYKELVCGDSSLRSGDEILDEKAGNKSEHT